MPQLCEENDDGRAEICLDEKLSISQIPRAKGRIELGDVTHHNIKQMKRLNQIIFPVVYNDKFYADVQEAGELAKYAYFNDIIVGAVCCRIDLSDDKKRLYIMTLGCLPAYRRLGLGRLMLEHVFNLCKRDRSIESIFLHVQTSNETAIAFYDTFGFEVMGEVKNYYKRIEPADAYILEKRLRPLPAIDPANQNHHHHHHQAISNVSRQSPPPPLRSSNSLGGHVTVVEERLMTFDVTNSKISAVDQSCAALIRENGHVTPLVVPGGQSTAVAADDVNENNGSMLNSID